MKCDFISTWGFLLLISIKGGKNVQMGTQKTNILVNLDVILGLQSLLCLISTPHGIWK